MSQETDQKIIEGIASATLNSFNINGIVNASRFYAMHLANERFKEMTDEEKSKALEEIETMEKQVAEQSQKGQEEAKETAKA